MTPEETRAFLSEPRIADLATVQPDGAPHVAPVWFLYDGEKVRIITDPYAVKVRNIRHDPRVAISIANGEKPYRYVLVRGEAQVSYEDAPEVMLALALHYMGEAEGRPYAEGIVREEELCVLTVMPSRITGWSEEDED